LELIVRDGGPGLGPDFDPENSDTLGLKLVSALVRQIDGRLEYGSDNGAWFRITVPGSAAV
jgi:two-component sensor histidine kinase